MDFIRMKSLRRFIILFCSIIWLVFACGCYGTQIEYDWQIDYLHASEVWNITTGENITVAVIDSGLDYDMLGSDFDTSRILATYNSYDESDDMTDYTHHGTAMVYLIGANGENGFYGIAPDCKFIVIKALNVFGNTNAEALARGINFAVENGADIINLSLGSSKAHDNITTAIQTAVENNIIVTCAAGDQSKESVMFPASLDETLSVGALDKNSLIYEESNYGDDIDIFAPGVDVNIPTYNYLYEVVSTQKSGSSIATAIVSGILALYLDYIGNYDAEEVYTCFRNMTELDLREYIS